MANKTIKTAVINTLGNAVKKGNAFDRKYNITIQKERKNDIRSYDLFLGSDLAYTVHIADNWEMIETFWITNEYTKSMSKEVKERIKESKAYGFSDI